MMSSSVSRLCRDLGGWAAKLARGSGASFAHDPDLLQAIGDAEETENTRARDKALKDYAERVVSLQDYARELSLLGLTGRSFTAEMYAEALEQHLGLRISITRTPNNAGNDADIRKLGATSYDVENGLVAISVPLRLGWWLYQYALHHELGHVAAGHPLPIRSQDGEIAGFKEPANRIGRRPPAARASATKLPNGMRLRLVEAEAELRARRGMLAGSLGSTVVQTGSLTQVR